MSDLLTPTDETRDEIVADLEAILEDARAGLISAYVFVAVKSDSNLARGMVIPGGHANGLLYLALDVAKQQIMDRVAEAYQPPMSTPVGLGAPLGEDPSAGYEVEPTEDFLPTEEELALTQMLQPAGEVADPLAGSTTATGTTGDPQPLAPRKRRSRKGA